MIRSAALAFALFSLAALSPAASAADTTTTRTAEQQRWRELYAGITVSDPETGNKAVCSDVMMNLDERPSAVRKPVEAACIGALATVTTQRSITLMQYALPR